MARKKPKDERYREARRKRIEALTDRHSELFESGFTHDGYMHCACDVARELRALLRLDLLGARKES